MEIIRMPGRRERLLTTLCLCLTLVATGFTLIDIGNVAAIDAAGGNWPAVLEATLFAVLVLMLINGNVAFQLARIGLVDRLRRDPGPLPAGSAGPVRPIGDASIVILVPSYREDPAVIRKTLLSAALQNGPRRRLVLLIDDPPEPGDLAAARLLRAARRLPDEIERLLGEPRRQVASAQERLASRLRAGRCDGASERQRLADLHDRLAAWFRTQADSHPLLDHTDRFFVDHVWRRLELMQRDAAWALRCPAPGSAEPSGFELNAAHRSLLNLFDCPVTSFERKLYANLSHEPNKAMNLNSYIACLGGRFEEREEGPGRMLRPVPAGAGSLEIPDADYALTLDADSIILPDYAERLVAFMEQPGNARLAIVQTPYAAFPRAPGVLERIAGATTDVQLLMHQGFTRYGATFWVGANAVVRRAALEDIRTVTIEGGHPIARYIQDRTVIEDTESTIDLALKGWRLHNYPARLAYSATPPDFGSLLIQRRRWANGGLIILPKLLRYLAGQRLESRLPQAILRLYYLGSIAWSTVGLLILLLYPFDPDLVSFWLPLTAVPYFLLYGRALVELGYRATDLLRVYALNLLLIPVQLGGVIKSVQQIWSGRKIPFGRTPKVRGRTSVPALYLVAAHGMTLYALAASIVDYAAGRHAHAAFSLINAAFLGYASTVFIGIGPTLADIRAALRSTVPAVVGRRPERPRRIDVRRGAAESEVRRPRYGT
jgi:cellulose synthase/poly-beta-1,6-N-acetylglucosamine synthase-like glycosyltransferase